MSKDKVRLEKILEARLQRWGRWLLLFSSGTGWHTKSVEARMMETGCIRIEGTGMKIIPADLLAEEIEGWVKALYARKPERANVLREKYTSAPELTHQNLAKRLKMSLSMFDLYLQLSREYLMGRLEDQLLFKEAA